MSLSVETLAVARKYTDDSLAGAGAVAGVPCKIQSITAITGGNRVTFLWTDNNGDDHTSAMDVMNGVDGEDGKGIQSVSINAQNHLIITYTDGTTVDAGWIEIHSSVDSVNGQTGAVVLDAEDVGALPDDTPIPSKTSDLTNDSGFITKVVNDLVNYYLKSETYSKTEVDDIVTAIKNSRFEVVATLPTTDIKTNVIYLVPKSPSQTSNVKDEYINLNGTTAGWEKIGDTEIDLSDYVTTQALNTALADYTTTADLTTLLAGKQDTLTFDNVPTENSNNPVKSGGVYAANQTLMNNVDVLFETGVKNICPPYSGSYSANGITYIGNSDGTVTVNGTCSANTGANVRVYLKAGQYKVSGCPRGGSYSTYRIGVTTDSWTLIGTHDHGNGTTITIPSDDYYRINLDVREGYVANNLVFKPMITDVDTPESDYDHYVPYAKTNQQLTEDSVTWDNLSEVGAVNDLENKGTTQVDATTGLTFTVNDDKSVTVSATSGTYPHTVPSAKAFIFNSDSCDNLKDGKVYRLSGCPSGGGSSSYYIAFYQSDVVDKSDQGNGYVFAKTASMTSVLTQISIKANAVLSSAITFYPMIAPVDYNGPYVPYAKTNRELTEKIDIVGNLFTTTTKVVDNITHGIATTVATLENLPIGTYVVSGQFSSDSAMNGGGLVQFASSGVIQNGATCSTIINQGFKANAGLTGIFNVTNATNQINLQIYTANADLTVSSARLAAIRIA